MGKLILPHISLINVFEIVMLAVIVYYVAKTVQGTRVMILLKGFAFLGGAYVAAVWLNLHVLRTILLGFFIVAAFTMVTIFNSEIRRFIESIGARITKVKIRDLFNTTSIKEEYFTSDTIKALADAVVHMSEQKTGALIVLQKDVPLDDIVKTGLEIDAAVTSQLLINIFEKNTPLHDGAVIISDNRVKAATCILPLTQQAIDRRFGTRHRAAIGVSEAADCCVLVVSEETGGITFVHNSGSHSPLKDRSEVIAKLRSIQEKPEKQEETKHAAVLERAQHNISLKFVSGIAAAVIWATITLVNDPMTSITYTATIEPINESAITEIGQVYELTQDKVRVTVKVRTSMLDEFNASDIVVYADMSKLSYTNAVPLSGEIPTLNTAAYELILGDESINVTLDELTEASVPIKTEISGKVAEGMYLSDVRPVNDNITIKCGAALAKTIDAAYVMLDVTDKSESYTSAFGFALKDKNGSIITPKNYSSVDTCDVEVVIEPTKAIPVKVKINEALRDVYNIQEITLDKEFLTVIGSDSALQRLPEYEVVIDSIEITDPAIKKYVKTAKAALPEGVVAIEGSDTVTIELTIAPEATKTIQLTSKEIDVVGLADGLKLKISNEPISIAIYGTQEEIDKIDAKNIKAYISAQELTEGQYNLLVMLETKVYASTATANVTISKGG